MKSKRVQCGKIAPRGVQRANNSRTLCCVGSQICALSGDRVEPQIVTIESISVSNALAYRTELIARGYLSPTSKRSILTSFATQRSSRSNTGRARRGEAHGALQNAGAQQKTVCSIRASLNAINKDASPIRLSHHLTTVLGQGGMPGTLHGRARLAG